MAKTVLLECDRCGSSKGVVSLDGTRGDGKNIDVDLCPKCWAQAAKDFGMRVTDRQPRRPFRVTDPSEIPHTT